MMAKLYRIERIFHCFQLLFIYVYNYSLIYKTL
jgi:hypothetical protein